MKKPNNLLSQNPSLSSEWNYKKNHNLIPSSVAANSRKRVWWTCKNGHEWEAKISNRISGNNCPYCCGRKINKNNSFGSICSNLISEWNYKRNKINPFAISPWSHNKVWWICKNGHEWEAQINQRNSLNTKCPICRKNIIFKTGERFCSLSEAYFYIKNKSDITYYDRYYPSHNGQSLGKSRFDFYISKDNKYIEVTSYSNKWHGWNKYKNIILTKEKYVKNILHANFEFIQYRFDNKKIEMIEELLK